MADILKKEADLFKKMTDVFKKIADAFKMGDNTNIEYLVFNF